MACLPLLDSTVCDDIDDITDPRCVLILPVLLSSFLLRLLLVLAEVGGERNVTLLLEITAEGVSRTRY